MSRLLKITLALAAALAVAAPADAAEEPGKQEYTAQVEPICQANTIANKRILEGVQQKVKDKKLAAAGAQFTRAATAFGRTTGKIAAVPPPPAEASRLEKWIDHLRLVEKNLRTVGRDLKGGDRLQATYDTIKLRSSANAANNVVYNFEFHYCHLTSSRFLGTHS